DPLPGTGRGRLLHRGAAPLRARRRLIRSPRSRLVAALIGPVLVSAACGSPRPITAPSPPARISPSAPTHASLLVGPSWFVLVAASSRPGRRPPAGGSRPRDRSSFTLALRRPN